MPLPSAPRGHAMNFDLGAVITGVAAAAGVNSPDQQNPCFTGAKIVVDITAFTGTSITVTVQGKDVASGKYYTVLASAALAAVATTVLTVYPGIIVAANVAANDVIPRVWRIATSGTFSNVSYTVGCCLIV